MAPDTPYLTYTKRNGRAARPNPRIMRRWRPSAKLTIWRCETSALAGSLQGEGLVYRAVGGKHLRPGNKQNGSIFVRSGPSWKMRFCGTVDADVGTGELLTRRARCLHSSRLFSIPVGSVLHRYRAGDAVGCGRMANL